MKTLQKPILENGEDESTFSLAAFRASLLVAPGSEEARKMTATSGRTCTAALTKSSPIGSLVKTLLASSRWLNKAVFLKWQVRQLYSERKIRFTDTNTEEPLPWNESAVTSKPTDMRSSRFLFQLALLGHPTDEIESSSSDIEKIPTFHGDQYEEAVRAAHNMVAGGLLNTPVADGLKCRTTHHGQRRMNGKALEELARLLPTPTAIEGYKYTNTWNPNSQMGQSLSAMAGSGMLPTPRVSGQEGYESRAKRKGHECAMSYLETAVDYVAHQTNSVPDGESSRLSPLFSEEMMGFPLMWTTLPFLSRNGETSQSKPTATPSSPK